MKISLNTIRNFNRRYGCAEEIAPAGVGLLVERIGAQLGAVDEVTDFGTKYEGVVVAKVVKCEPHPNADKLKLCTIDTGGIIVDYTPSVKGGVPTSGLSSHDGATTPVEQAAAPGKGEGPAAGDKAAMTSVAKAANDYIQVVCGAPNVREGLLVAWLPPGTTVPNTADKEPFVLEAREIRGQLSHGMLASPKELGLGDNHEGILELDGDIAPGTAFADAYDLRGDMVIDIENKMFTHRPDLFGFLGVARELAGIQGMPFKSPDWYRLQPDIPAIEAEALKLEVRNELPGLARRFTAVTMRDVEVGPSPVWLQIELAKVGQKSINNIVDYANWFMLETGQPLHTFDYDKVKALSGGDGATLVVRPPKPGEQLALLNGKTVTPRPKAIMIATDRQPISIAGVMGGHDTEVDTQTKNVILEVANFDMYSIRRTSMAHGLFTDAVTRFTKGQSPLQTVAVLAKITDEIRQYAGGKVASRLIDDVHLDSEVLKHSSLYEPVTLSMGFINDRLGLHLSVMEIKALLENVEFKVEIKEEELTVTAPFWRTDIELREDVVEEVGRLYGYDKLPLELPRRDLTPAAKDPLFELKAKVRDRLSRAGANEVLTYSFVPGSLLDKAGQDRAQAYEIGNALSPDLQYYRLSLTPSLLEKVHANVKAGYGQFALFEIGKAHILGETDPAEADVPKEVNALSFVYAAKKPGAGVPYYWARQNLQELLVAFQAAGLVKLEPLAGADLYKNPWVEQMVVPYEPSRAAVLRDAKGLIWGVVGEFTSAVRRQLKLPDYTAGFEIDPLLLLQNASPDGQRTYTPLPRFPKITQDITLRLPVQRTHDEIMNFFWSEYETRKLGEAVTTLDLLDIYQANEADDHKNVTLRFTIASYDRTLTDAEVNKLLDAVAAAAKTRLDAERV